MKGGKEESRGNPQGKEGANGNYPKVGGQKEGAKGNPQEQARELGEQSGKSPRLESTRLKYKVEISPRVTGATE